MRPRRERGRRTSRRETRAFFVHLVSHVSSRVQRSHAKKRFVRNASLPSWSFGTDSFLDFLFCSLSDAKRTRIRISFLLPFGFLLPRSRRRGSVRSSLAKAKRTIVGAREPARTSKTKIGSRVRRKNKRSGERNGTRSGKPTRTKRCRRTATW